MNTLELSKELMAFETISPVEDPEPFEFLQLYLEDHGIKSKVVEFDGVKNLVAEIGSGSPRICFNGHMDVVDPGEGWEVTEPFDPKVKDGKLYGRGAADMKTGVAAMTNALIELDKDDGFTGSVVLMVVGDEEIGGDRGTAAIIQEKHPAESFDYAIVGEPTDMNVQVGTRGVAWFDVFVEGEEIHATRSHQVDNVFDSLPRIVRTLNSLGIDAASGKLPDPEMTVTTIESNETYNSVPSRVRVGLDVRYVPDQDAEEIGDRIQRILDLKYENCEVSLKTDHGGAYILEDDKLLEAVSEGVETASGRFPDHITEGGASDGRFFGEKGCPFVELGVNQEPGHQSDESCDVETLGRLKEAYVKTAKNLNT